MSNRLHKIAIAVSLVAWLASTLSGLLAMLQNDPSRATAWFLFAIVVELGTRGLTSGGDE